MEAERVCVISTVTNEGFAWVKRLPYTVRAKTEIHTCTESSIVSTQSLSSLNSSANQAQHFKSILLVTSSLIVKNLKPRGDTDLEIIMPELSTT